MDTLDKWTVCLITVLVLYGALLLSLAEESNPVHNGKTAAIAAQQHIATPELVSKIQLAKNLLSQDNVAKTEQLVDSLLKEYPYEGKLYMLKGDIFLRRQQPVAAMYEYKEAIGLNPDFLDKKTELFQGKKIRVTVNEAMAAIETGIKQFPGDQKLRVDRETVYYMKRKLAGSCG